MMNHLSTTTTTPQCTGSVVHKSTTVVLLLPLMIKATAFKVHVYELKQCTSGLEDLPVSLSL